MSSLTNHQSQNVDSSTSLGAAAGAASKQVNSFASPEAKNAADGILWLGGEPQEACAPASNRGASVEKSTSPGFAETILKQITVFGPDFSIIRSFNLDPRRALPAPKKAETIKESIPRRPEPDYHAPIRTSLFTASVDDVRLAVWSTRVFCPDGPTNELLELMSRLEATSPRLFTCVYDTPSPKVGGFRRLWTMAVGQGSDGKPVTMTVMLGLRNGGKIYDHIGVITFNPNKVAGQRYFPRLWAQIDRCVDKSYLRRWDAAFDIPCARWRVRLYKDRRKYAYIVDPGDPASVPRPAGGARGYEKDVTRAGVTEYLGCRSAVGRVKLYDKTREAHLAAPMTRLEITMPGLVLDPEHDLFARWPLVSVGPDAHGSVAESHRITSAYLLAELESYGVPAETLLPHLADTRSGWRLGQLRRQLAAYGQRAPLPCPDDELVRLWRRACAWQKAGTAADEEARAVLAAVDGGARAEDLLVANYDAEVERACRVIEGDFDAGQMQYRLNLGDDSAA